MLSVQQGLKDEGVTVPMTKLCQWFGVARRTTYYKPTKGPAKVNAELAEPIKEMIEAEPSFGYRTEAALLGMNRNTVQRIFQLKGWQVRNRPIGQRPRIEAKISRAEGSDQRWATDLCRVWGGKDGWLSLALVIDCGTRELLGWHLSRTGRASTASAALEQTLITRYGTRGCRCPSCCARTTAWCSPVATTRGWCVAMACSRSSSRHTARSRMEWWNE